jgi:hypothetical protein
MHAHLCVSVCMYVCVYVCIYAKADGNFNVNKSYDVLWAL